jgi:hypothetical protein
VKLQLPQGVVEQVKQDAQNGKAPADKELQRILSLLDSVTRTAYSVIGDYKDRRDLPGVLAAVDRLNVVTELRIQLYEITRKQ